MFEGSGGGDPDVTCVRASEDLQYIAVGLSNGSVVLFRGADPHVCTEMGENAVLLATANGHTHVVRQLLDAGASVEMEWMGINALDVAQTLGRESAQQTIRAYESHFAGHISKCRGCSCVASW